MALSFFIFAATVLQVFCETSVIKTLLPGPSDCCAENGLVLNGTCTNSTQCEPGCFLRILQNDTAICMLCDALLLESDNFSSCNYIPVKTNLTLFTTVMPKIGGPGVVASLLLGTLFASLFLILSVASFFYLKRSNRLPGIFYRRNKVRKPRYVRRERPSAAAASAAATISTAAVTKVSNV